MAIVVKPSVSAYDHARALGMLRSILAHGQATEKQIGWLIGYVRQQEQRP